MADSYLHGVESEELVGVPNVHGIGLVRRRMRLSRKPRPSMVKVFLGALPAKAPTPPSFKGTHTGQLAVPQDKKVTYAFRWDGKQWLVIPRADAEKAIKERGLKTASATPAKPKAPAAPKAQSTSSPNSAKAPTGVSPNRPAQPPAQPGRFVGEIFLPSNKQQHAWRWDGSAWRGISRSDAVKTPTAATTKAAGAAATEANKSVLEKFTDSLKTAATAVGLTKPTPLPHPSVPTITDNNNGAVETHPPGVGTQQAPVTVPTTVGPVKLPTKLDPDADGQVAPGVPAPPPVVGKPGTFPSTARDPNGDGIEDATGRPAPKPTVGVAGTFPSTPLDPNGDGIIDSTGQPTVPPLLGQKGSFPVTPDDADGDGINDTTGKPLNANGVDASGLGSLALPIVGLLAALALSRKPGGSTHQWR